MFKSISPAVSKTFIKMILYSTWMRTTNKYTVILIRSGASRSYKEITKIQSILGYQNIPFRIYFSQNFLSSEYSYDLCRWSCNQLLSVLICTRLINTWKIPDKIPINVRTNVKTFMTQLAYSNDDHARRFKTKL